MNIGNLNNDEKDNLLDKLKKRPDLVGLQYTLEQLDKFVKFTNAIIVLAEERMIIVEEEHQSQQSGNL